MLGALLPVLALLLAGFLHPGAGKCPGSFGGVPTVLPGITCSAERAAELGIPCAARHPSLIRVLGNRTIVLLMTLWQNDSLTKTVILISAAQL